MEDAWLDQLVARVGDRRRLFEDGRRHDLAALPDLPHDASSPPQRFPRRLIRPYPPTRARSSSVPILAFFDFLAFLACSRFSLLRCRLSSVCSMRWRLCKPRKLYSYPRLNCKPENSPSRSARPDVAGAKKADADLDQSSCASLVTGLCSPPCQPLYAGFLLTALLDLALHRISKPLDPTSRPLDTDSERRHRCGRSQSSRPTTNWPVARTRDLPRYTSRHAQ